MAAAPLILAVGSSLLSAASSSEQGKIEESQARVAASQQELQVVQREADRKERLASSLASQNALAGARGIAAFEGSPLTILQDSIEKEQTATERDKFTTGLSTIAARSTGKVRRQVAQTSAGLKLLQGASSAARTGV